MKANNHDFLMDAGKRTRKDTNGMGNENSSFSKSDGTLEIPHLKFTHTSLIEKSSGYSPELKMHDLILRQSVYICNTAEQGCNISDFYLKLLLSSFLNIMTWG